MSLLVPAVRPHSANDIENQALSITARYYPYLLKEPGSFPVLHFFDLLREEYGLEPGVEPLSDGVEGVTWPDGRVILSEQTYRAAHEGQGRGRFTVVHEAYHGIEHRGQIRNALIHTGKLLLHRRQSIVPFRDPEWQANTFASAILMPAAMVSLVASSYARIAIPIKMMKFFGVSQQAAEVRLKKLGL
jgi:hypothetical protein